MDPENADAGGGDDIVVTDRQLFDSALSEPAPQPRPEPQPPPPPPPTEPPTEPQPPPQASEPGERPRDAQGRFTGGPQPRPQGRPQPQGDGQQPAQHQVPLRELLDERERRYRLQAEADQMRRAWAELEQRAQAHALAQQQQQMPQTIYDNPDQYLQHNVIAPLRNEGHMAMLQIKDGLSREMANAQFGHQLVGAALQAMTSIRDTPNGDHVYRQIMASAHPYGALVQWFQQARMQQAIGPDPQAWLHRQRQAWLDDEAMQAEAVRRYQARQQPQQSARSGGPNVQLPPSLSSLPASSGRAEAGGDLSDAHLWRFATR